MNEGWERRQEEDGLELEMSVIPCWISSVCPSRSLSTLVHCTHGRTSMGSLALQLPVDSPSEDPWQETGRREKREVRVFAPLFPPMMNHLGLAASPS